MLSETYKDYAAVNCISLGHKKLIFVNIYGLYGKITRPEAQQIMFLSSFQLIT